MELVVQFRLNAAERSPLDEVLFFLDFLPHDSVSLTIPCPYMADHSAPQVQKVFCLEGWRQRAWHLALPRVILRTLLYTDAPSP